MSLVLNLSNTSFCLTVIYRPPPSRRNNLKLKSFWKEWADLLTLHISSNFDFVIVGDLNLHLDIANSSNTSKFLSILDEFNLTQHIQEKTHVDGHTLDILVTSSSSDIASQISVFDLNFCTDKGEPIKDHYAIKWNMIGAKKEVQEEKFATRSWKNFCHESFGVDLNISLLASINKSSDLVITYNSILEDLIETHAPLKIKTKSRKLNPWYSDDLKVMKRRRRQLERKAKKSKSNADKYLYKQNCHAYYRHLRISVLNHNKKLISDTNGDQKKLHSIANKLLGNSIKPKYPDSTSNKELADSFMKFFIEKVKLIREDLPVNSNHNHTPTLYSSGTNSPPILSSFEPATETEITELIKSMPSKQCKLDPVPTWVLKKHLNSLVPVITEIVNQSLMSGVVHPSLKSAVIRPILKSPTLDHNKFENFRPVSNLPFLAKVLEKVVYNRLNTHLETNQLLPCNQSAYKKCHSTETAILKVQNDILTSLDQDKVVALILLDISAAFDTVDHHRLLECFSSNYGLTGTVLKWMESYLSNRSQKVSVYNCESFTSQMEHGFPQGAVLAGILYNMYSAPLHKEVQKHPPDHHGYADDNGL